MSELILKFYGTIAETTADTDRQLRDVQPTVKITEYRAATVRSTGKEQKIEISDDALVALQMSNDVEWHYNAEDFQTFLHQKGATRSTDGVVELPSFFVSTSGTRGVEEIVTTKVLRVITGMAAKHTAELLVEKMESKLKRAQKALSSIAIYSKYSHSASYSKCHTGR